MTTQEYTVFAVYEENLQPYAAWVECETAEEACRLAQLQAACDNDPNGEYPEPDKSGASGNGWVEALGDFGDYTLTAYQVVLGRVETVL